MAMRKEYNETELAKLMEMIQQNDTALHHQLQQQQASSSQQQSQQHSGMQPLPPHPVVIDRMMQQPPAPQPPLAKLLGGRNMLGPSDLNSLVDPSAIYISGGSEKSSTGSIRSDSSATGASTSSSRPMRDQPRIMHRGGNQRLPIKEDHRYRQLQQELSSHQLPQIGVNVVGMTINGTGGGNGGSGIGGGGPSVPESQQHLRWTPTDSSANSCSSYSSSSISSSSTGVMERAQQQQIQTQQVSKHKSSSSIITNSSSSYQRVTPPNAASNNVFYGANGGNMSNNIGNSSAMMMNQQTKNNSQLHAPKLNDGRTGNSSAYHQMLVANKSDNGMSNGIPGTIRGPNDPLPPPPLPPHRTNSQVAAPPRPPSQPPQQQQQPQNLSSDSFDSTANAQQQQANIMSNNILQQYLKRQMEAAAAAASNQINQQQSSGPQSPSASAYSVSSRSNAFSYASSASSSSPQHGSSPISFPVTNSRLRAAVAAASGQHHSSGSNIQQQHQQQQQMQQLSNDGGANISTDLLNQVMQQLSMQLKITGLNENPYSSSPPSYAASSSSGRQSTTPTISSSSDYASIPGHLMAGGGQQQQHQSHPQMLQSMHRKISPVTSSLNTLQHSGNLADQKATAGIVINSAVGQVTHGMATGPMMGGSEMMNNHNNNNPNQQSMQPCSIRKAVTQSPVIMQSVKSQKIQKPTPQTALAPVLPPNGPPASASATIKTSSSSVSSAAVRLGQAGQLLMNNGDASAALQSPLSISLSNSNLSIPTTPGRSQTGQQQQPPPMYPSNMNCPSPASSTTSSVRSGSTNQGGGHKSCPPPPYSSTSNHYNQRPGSSCSSTSATSSSTLPNSAGAGAYHATPPPPYSSAIQSAASRTALNPYQKMGLAANQAAPPPPPPPAYPMSLSAPQHDSIAQLQHMLGLGSPPASQYGGSNSSVTSSSTTNNNNANNNNNNTPKSNHVSQQSSVQIPTTDPPSYASSMAALAAQRVAGHGNATISTQSLAHPAGGYMMTGGQPTMNMANRPLPQLPPNANQPQQQQQQQQQQQNSDLVNVVESICTSQISALQSGPTNPRLNRGLPAITDSTVPPLPPKPHVQQTQQQQQQQDSTPPPPPPLPPSHKYSALDSNANLVSDESNQFGNNGNNNNNIGNYDEVTVDTTTAEQEDDGKHTHHSPIPIRRSLSNRSGEFKMLKNCSSAAYKFFMEQHVENLVKSQKQREMRRQQLESEMAKVGLPEQAQNEMRRMLCQKESNYIRLRRAKMDRSMFKKIKTIGVGAFGEVSLVRNESNVLYAMKTLRKAHVLKRNQVAHVKAERDILAEADNEWVVKLYYSFQDEKNLYFVMDYIPGGDLMSLLIKLKVFSESLARFYIAELTLAVESVHKMGFIHRDIKPDNILIDKDGHIKLTDFGLCTGFRWTHNSKYYHEKGNSMDWDSGALDGRSAFNCNCADMQNPAEQGNVMGDDQISVSKPLERRKHRREHHRCLAHSLVGTPNYIAPEVLLRHGYTQLCDWWSVGVIFYEMVVGSPPFYTNPPEETTQKVINWRRTLHIPAAANLSQEAKDLIIRLCCDAQDRIGAEEIKRHRFFGQIFETNMRSQHAPYIPEIKHPTDTSNFDAIDPSQLLYDPSDPEEDGEIGDRFDQFDNIARPPKTTKPKGGGQQVVLPSDPSHPQHAFFEFTFRRFFDSSGQAYPIKMATVDDSLQNSHALAPSPSDTSDSDSPNVYGAIARELPMQMIPPPPPPPPPPIINANNMSHQQMDQNGNSESTNQVQQQQSRQNGDSTSGQRMDRTSSNGSGGSDHSSSTPKKSTDPNGNLVFV